MLINNKLGLVMIEKYFLRKTVTQPKLMKNAVWMPLISKKTLLLAFVLFSNSLIFMVFFLEDHWGEGSSKLVRDICMALADVRYMSSVSAFPYVTSITYAFAIISAPLLAFLFCITKIEMQELQSFINQKSILSRVIFAIGCVVFAVAPFFLEFGVSDDQKSSGFFKGVAEHRFFLLLYVEGVLVIYSLFWGLFLFELKNLVNLGGKQE